MDEEASFHELFADLSSDIVGTNWLLCSSLMMARGQGNLDLRKLWNQQLAWQGEMWLNA